MKTEAYITIDLDVEDVLAACWAVNRSAKRYRDAASKCYKAKAYTFATAAKHRKEECYRLKDRAIRWLAAQGVIRPAGLLGVLTVWRGSGYVFHSLWGPEELTDIADEDVELRVEAKPKEKGEMRLKDARRLLEALPVVELPDMITRTFPPRPRHSYYSGSWREEEEFWEEEWEEEEEEDYWWQESTAAGTM